MDKLGIFLILNIFLIVCCASAISVDSVNVETVSPGEEGIIRVNVENDGNNDVDLVSFRLIFPDSKIIPIGSSDAFLNTLNENDDESFSFKFRVGNDLPAGTYSIAYVLNYEENNDNVEQKGTIGIVVSADPEIEILADPQNSIVGQQGSLSIRIINRGLADARFVYLFVESEDITLLSENSEYIGTIDSDDFETSSFDVIYNSRFPLITAKVTYKDFNNNEQEIIETVSLRVYATQEAIEKGILKKSNAPTYVGIVLLLLVIWIVYRIIRKRRKKKD